MARVVRPRAQWKQQTCGICRTPGHNRLTCRETEAEQLLKPCEARRPKHCGLCDSLFHISNQCPKKKTRPALPNPRVCGIGPRRRAQSFYDEAKRRHAFDDDAATNLAMVLSDKLQAGGCPRRTRCLDAAAERNWSGFDCVGCALYDERQGAPLPVSAAGVAGKQGRLFA